MEGVETKIKKIFVLFFLLLYNVINTASLEAFKRVSVKIFMPLKGAGEIK